MSEKFKNEKIGKTFSRCSHSYIEERFFLMTKILNFAAICNKKRFSEWAHLSLIYLLFVPGTLVAQVFGKILDSESLEPVSYGVISWNGGTNGVVSNIDGEFEIVDLKPDSLCVSALAFKDTCLAPKPTGTNELLIYLDRQIYDLPEIEVGSIKLARKEFQVSDNLSTGIGGSLSKLNYFVGTEFSNEQLGVIESVSIFFGQFQNSKMGDKIMRLRILTFNDENFPEYDLLTEFVPLNPRRKNRWLTIDLEKYDLRLDKRNFLVAVEYVKNPDLEVDKDSREYGSGWSIGLSEIPANQEGLIQMWDKLDGGPWGKAPNFPIKNVVPMIKVSARVYDP